MQLSLDVIDSLRETALYIGGVLSEATIPKNAFMYADHANLPRYKLGENSIECYIQRGVILLHDIRPKRIRSLEVSPPTEFNKQRDSFVLDVYTNSGDTEIKEEETYTEEHSHTIKTNILAEINTSLKTKLGASYAGFSGEVEAQLSAKLGVNHSDEEVDKKGVTKKFNFDIPPWTKTSISQEHYLSDVSEEVKLICELDCDIGIYSEKDWTKVFADLEQLTIYMRGGAVKTYGNAPDLDNFVATRKFEKFDLDSEILGLPNKKRIFSISQERISRNVSTGEITRTDTEIKHGNI